MCPTGSVTTHAARRIATSAVPSDSDAAPALETAPPPPLPRPALDRSRVSGHGGGCSRHRVEPPGMWAAASVRRPPFSACDTSTQHAPRPTAGPVAAHAGAVCQERGGGGVYSGRACGCGSMVPLIAARDRAFPRTAPSHSICRRRRRRRRRRRYFPQRPRAA